MARPGDIDRERLGGLVFNDAAARRRLNAATHLPVALSLARALLLSWLSCKWVVVSICALLCICMTGWIFVRSRLPITNPVYRTCVRPPPLHTLTCQVVDMPLLFETKSHKLTRPNVLVACSPEQQVRKKSTRVC